MDAARNAKVQRALAALLALLVALVMAIAPAPAWAEDESSTTGSYTVYTYSSSGWAAGTTYTDFAKAVESCNATDAGYCYILVGSDLTLTSDVSFTNSSCYGLLVTGDVTIDLGGCELTFATYYYSIQVSGSSASLTLTNGTIKDTAKMSGYETISVMSGATLETSELTVETTAPSSGANYIIYSYTYSGGTQSITLGENTVLKSTGDYDGKSGYVYGVAIMGTGSGTTATAGNSLTLDGATITTSYFAIAGSGSVHGTTITISDSTLTSTAGTAIYLPQNGTTTIYDSTITGALCGIEIRSGILDIYGDTTVSSKASSFSCTANGSGTTTVGAAIAVSQQSTDIAISVTIHDGTYSGIYAVYENDIQNDSSSNISVSIEDGTFTTTSTATDAAAVSAVDSGTLTISGGTYSVTPNTSYIDTDYYSVETVTATDEDGNATTTYVVISKYEASYTTTDSDGNTTVAYDTLANALSKVSSGGTVTLLKDVTASVTVSSTVTLDLNGWTLTNESGSHTITVASGGNLTVVDSSYDGSGVVDNVTTKCAALYVQEGGTAALKGGTFRRSAETGTSENTYYTILNQGTLTIADGTTVELLTSDGTAATYSSIIDNGWYSGSPSTSGNTAKLYITGGTINGGKYVKNDSYGEMYISGGTITGGSSSGAILNWNVLEISGGTIENSSYAIFNCATSGTTYETGSVTITGGTFTYGTSLLTSGSTSDDVSVSGGSFSTEVDSLYCADGYVPATEQDEDGLYTVTTGTFVASVSNASGTLLAKYTDLQDAIDAAKSGYTVTLLGNLTITDSYISISESITLDLGGYTLTFKHASGGTLYRACIIVTDGDATIKNGTISDERHYGFIISASLYTIWMYGESLTTSDLTIQAYSPNNSKTEGASTYYHYLVYAQPDGSGNYPSITLGSGTILKDLGNSHSSYETEGCVGVTLLGAYSNSEAQTMRDNDTLSSMTNTSLTVKSGVTITTKAYAICGNGAKHGTSITIEGGTITSTGSTAIYHPQYGTLTVSGGTISGVDAGIEIRAGELTVTGGTITATATSFSAEANGSGTTVTGAAVAVSQHTTNLPLSVTITGGTLTGYYALYEADLQDSDTDDITLKLAGGTFYSTGKSGAIYSADCTAFVYPGTYADTAIDEDYCATGYEPSGIITDTGLYTVIAYTAPEDLTVTYDGQKHSVTVETSDTSGKTTISYTYDGSTTTSAPEFTEAGTYEVTYTVSCTDSTNGTATATGTYTVTINQVQTAVSMSDVTVSYGTTYTQEATLSISDTSASGSLSLPEGAAATITYYTDVNCTTAWKAEDGETTPTAAGIYYAKAVYAGNTNFAGSSAIASLTISAADLAFSAVSYSGTYDGEAHGITVTADGATITYASSSDGEYSSDNPTYTNAGTYTVYYKIVKDNYNTVTGSTTVVIAKATPAITMDNVNVSYGDSYTVSATVTGVNSTTLTDSAVTYTYYTDSDCTTEWAATGSETQPTEAGTYYVKATYAGSDNYNEASATATITIAKAEQSLSYASDSVSVHLTDAVSNALTQTTVVGTVTYSSSNTSVATVDSDGTVTIVCAGTATITATAAATSNYSEASASYTLTVSDHSYSSDGTWTWSDDYSSATLTFSCTVDGCSTTTTVEGEVTSSTTDATCTKDGSTVYTATATYDGTEYTDTKTVTTDATGHEYEGTWTWADDYSSAALALVCANDSSHTVTLEGDDVTLTVATTDGTTTYTATATYDNVTYTDIKTGDAVEYEVTAGAEQTVYQCDLSSISITANGAYDKFVYLDIDGTALTLGEDYTAKSGSTKVTITTDTLESLSVGTHTVTFVYTDGTASTTLTVAEHDYEAVVTDPTCTEDGYTTYTCSLCGDSYTDDETDATGHSYVLTETVDATCTEDGYKVYTCENDSSHTYTETIDATGHTEGEAVTENSVDATCTEDGSYDTVVYCTVCGEELSRETVTVAATGHSYEAAEDATWSSDYSSATLTFTCSACGDTVTVDADDITYEVTTKATETEDGEGTYTATFTYDGTTYTCSATVVIAATGTDSDDSGSTDDGSTDSGTTDDSTTDDGTTDDSTTDSGSSDSSTSDATTTESTSADSGSDESELSSTGDSTAFTVGSITAMGILALAAGLASRRRRNAA